jgi:hypothetical protein
MWFRILCKVKSYMDRSQGGLNITSAALAVKTSTSIRNDSEVKWEEKGGVC